MKITFPHMGTLSIPIKTLLIEMNVDVMLPPPTSQKTIALGAKYAPESICLPFKANLGNIMESIALGADAFIMLGGNGPCRFGFYGHLIKQITDEHGFKCQFIDLSDSNVNKYKFFKNLNPDLTLKKFFNALRISWFKLITIEKIEERLFYSRPRTSTEGFMKLEKAHEHFLKTIDNAFTIKEIQAAALEFQQKASFLEVYKGESGEKVHVIRLVGDIFIMLDHSCNYNIIRELGKLGVQVSPSINVSTWLKSNIFSYRLTPYGRSVKKSALCYLKNSVGGHGLDTIGNSVNYAKKAAGIIHLMPLTCTPEIVARSILPSISTKFDIPVMYLTLDEHSSATNMYTRLEAFVDML
ncbi:putative nucleotide-binding protein (sugar kinase/HSP70/actin superfamily) [Desulfitispora alkaliphila]|uniref:CoA protein activase n=1 Tax=Desulfitispora alkaliphila TaxID=622674 RepID=UPI003D22D8DB